MKERSSPSPRATTGPKRRRRGQECECAVIRQPCSKVTLIPSLFFCEKAPFSARPTDGWTPRVCQAVSKKLPARMLRRLRSTSSSSSHPSTTDHNNDHLGRGSRSRPIRRRGNEPLADAARALRRRAVFQGGRPTPGRNAVNREQAPPLSRDVGLRIP